MRVRVLACDYDGTLASEDRIGPAAAAALAAAREAGLRLVLVTGRTFFDLTRVCEPLERFDAVVAENGGVLYFPASRTLRDLAPAPAPRLLAELDRRGIPFQRGRVVLGTARADEARVREALAATGIDLALVPNRAALMLLPVGITKGSGVRQAVRELGFSVHDVLAFGDAENDLDLFEACGFAACPASAVPELRARADWIFPGDDGAAVAAAITGPVLEGTLDPPCAGRHRVELGWAVETREPVGIPARGVNVLVQGDPHAGKSWLAGALVERLVARRYAVCVLDPEGDYQVLADLPGVAWAEVRSAPGLERLLAGFEHDPAASVVADLSGLAHEAKLRVIQAGLGRLRQLRRARGFPHWVVLDEAHCTLHREGVPDVVLDLEGKGFCLVTYRASWLRPSVLDAVDVFLLARTTEPPELARLGEILAARAPGGPRASAILPTLPPGEFVLVDTAAPGSPSPLTFIAGPRETAHVRHLRKYADAAVPAEHRFVFRHADGRFAGTAESLGRFREALRVLDPDVLEHHADRGDFSRWVLGVFADRVLGAQLRKTEARWRRGEISDLRQAIARLVAARYGADRNAE